jgi:hypothetical protein
MEVRTLARYSEKRDSIAVVISPRYFGIPSALGRLRSIAAVNSHGSILEEEALLLAIAVDEDEGDFR